MQNSEKVTKEIKFFESPILNDTIEEPCLFCGGENTTSVILDEKKHLITQCTVCSGAHYFRICNKCKCAFSDGGKVMDNILAAKKIDHICFSCEEKSIKMKMFRILVYPLIVLIKKHFKVFSKPSLSRNKPIARPLLVFNPELHKRLLESNGDDPPPKLFDFSVYGLDNVKNDNPGS